MLIARGQGAAEVTRTLGVSEVTDYCWRRKYGGLKTDQVRRMKAMEVENQRLRNAIAESMPDQLILQEAARGPEGQRRQNFRAPRAGAPVSSPRC